MRYKLICGLITTEIVFEKLVTLSNYTLNYITQYYISFFLFPQVTTFEDYYCEICDVRMTSTSDKMLHYSGKNHKKNMRDPGNAKKKTKLYVVLFIHKIFLVFTI